MHFLYWSVGLSLRPHLVLKESSHHIFFKGQYWPFCMFEPNLSLQFSYMIKPFFSFPDILQNLLIFQNQIFK
ncbi:hypothetical protein LDENG_00151840 [Lucifuga dentata]|nr:hypothetical protein LDENG_00151840 [Lucifuga dentata]